MSVRERLHPSLQDTEFSLDSIIAAPQELVDVQLSAIDLTTRLTKRTTLHLPIMSSPMDTVTGHRMAILMARLGGIGVIHLNYPSIDAQMREVEKVRRFEAGFVMEPVVVSQYATLADIRCLENQYPFRSFPVTEDGTLASKLAGLVTQKDTELYDKKGDLNKRVLDLMTPREQLVVARASETLDKGDVRAANALIRSHKLDTLPIVDGEDRVVALVTRSDMLKNQQDTAATKDGNKQLKVYVAVDSRAERAQPRIEAAVAAGAAGIVIDSRGMYLEHLDIAAFAKSLSQDLDVIVGNVVTASVVREALEKGGKFIDGFRVGMGTGEICITSERLGLGRGMGSALRDIRDVVDLYSDRLGHIGVIADGGIKIPWHIASAVGLGADAVMMGTELAGLDESPTVERWDPESKRQAKTVRGMGSQEVILERSGAGESRYGLYGIPPEERFAEGISKLVPFKGGGERFINNLLAGVRSTYQGLNARNTNELREKIFFYPRIVAVTKGMS